MPRHTLRVPNELVALDRLPRVHYVKQPRLDEIFRPIDSNRPVEYMPAETLDPAKGEPSVCHSVSHVTVSECQTCQCVKLS